jgi:hypothetical protein
MASIKTVTEVTIRRTPMHWTTYRYEITWRNDGPGSKVHTIYRRTFKGACRAARRLERQPKQ